MLAVEGEETRYQYPGHSAVTSRRLIRKEVEEIDLEIDSGEFFIKISDILRKYFQNNFYIISFEMTSAELKDFFKDKDLNNLLDRIDQVKFAQKTLRHPIL